MTLDSLVTHVLVIDVPPVLVLDNDALLGLGKRIAEQARLEVDRHDFPIGRAREQNVAIEAPRQVCDAHREGVHQNGKRLRHTRLPNSDRTLRRGERRDAIA